MAINNDWVSTEMNFGPDAWDDSTILDIFDDAIRSHKTKKGKKQTRNISSAGVAEKSAVTAPSSNESSDLPTRGSWAPVADAPINTDGFDDNRNSNANYDRATAYGSRCNNSFQKHLSSTTPREQYSKMFRTANVDTDTHATSNTNRRTQNTHSSPSSSSKPLDDCYAAEGDGADFYENQNQSEQTNEEQAASAALEESFNGMLMAWYQSGYATGRYQALLEQSKKSSNSQSHSQSQSQYRNQPPLQQQYQGQSQNNRNQPHELHSQSQSHARGGQPYPPKGSHS